MKTPRSPSNPTFVLIRHAHRDTSERDADNGLSAKGGLQAKTLYKHFKTRFGKPKKVLLFSSPKKRCIETIEPIAQYLKCNIALSELLLESNGESDGGLLKRVKRFFSSPMRAEVIVICSHGDWLPIALHELCGAIADFKKGSWAEVKEGQLLALIQPDSL